MQLAQALARRYINPVVSRMRFKKCNNSRRFMQLWIAGVCLYAFSKQMQGMRKEDFLDYGELIDEDAFDI